MMNRRKKRVIVGMSGGVDSSMTAALLKEEGYDVIGVTLQVWPSGDAPGQKGCCTITEIDDARRVAYQLGIPYYVMNFRTYFEEHVVDYFTGAYVRGETPNPCLACNRYVKFTELWRKAQGLGADYVATGHYARICQDQERGRWILAKGLDASKDQSYALYMLTQEQLSHILLPLGEYRKARIREMARQLGLSVVADKPDSQEICFVPDRDYAGFILRRKPEAARPGNFVDRQGTVLGRHQGILHYTVGQRKGLGVTFAKPMFVIGLDAEHDEVILGENDQTYTQTLWAMDMNWIAIPALTGPLPVTAKIRYRAAEAEAVVSAEMSDSAGCVQVDFSQRQRAVTPGQAVVFYQGNRVLGGGTIISDPLGRKKRIPFSV
ncbi:MAG: tRNA 2-thiouridine(34) synthase MnmA [Peptococcaceae bacterium]|jgi:tRNA-specific 2-thiouridylase|nr:tRNA 2-thiouridine(34) synthase MnmA [Peptococcaceae bacterium]